MKHAMRQLNPEEIAERRKMLTHLLKEGIIIIDKHIKSLQLNKENESLIECLRRGINNLNGRITLVMEGSWLEDVALKRIPGTRGGFGLSQGFDEILPNGRPWANEIMDSIHQIEDYYRNM